VLAMRRTWALGSEADQVSRKIGLPESAPSKMIQKLKIRVQLGSFLS